MLNEWNVKEWTDIVKVNMNQNVDNDEKQINRWNYMCLLYYFTIQGRESKKLRHYYYGLYDLSLLQ